VIEMCSKLNWHVQMKVAERGMSNLDDNKLRMGGTKNICHG